MISMLREYFLFPSRMARRLHSENILAVFDNVESEFPSSSDENESSSQSSDLSSEEEQEAEEQEVEEEELEEEVEEEKEEKSAGEDLDEWCLD